LPNAGDHLKEKDNENTTPEDVRITGSPGHLFFKAPTEDGVEGPAFVNPF